MAKIKVELGSIQETLLIPLLGRAMSTKQTPALLTDKKAVEIVERLDYDFSKWLGKESLKGACVRTRMFDEEVLAFLEKNPEGTIVEIGAGLNTRFERLDNGKARWFELDMPDSMALRRHFFQDTERRTMIASSVLETKWMDTVRAAAANGPFCFVSEAVIIYLEDADIKRMFRTLTDNFNGAWVVMDTTSPKMVESQSKHDIMKSMSKDSWFRWKVEDPASLSPCGLQLVHSKSFVDASSEIRACMPIYYRLVITLAPWILRRVVDGYRINLFTLK